MATFTLQQVLGALDGQLLVRGPQGAFTGVSTDTRALQPGDLFIAISGERFNGHAFLDEAQRKGAAGAVIAEDVPGVRRRTTRDGDWHIIEVTDTLYALGQLARYHRRQCRIPVIAITGSAGKTTTKEMTAAILEQGRQVLKTHGNFNNEIGLPLTLLGLTADHQAAVLEMGMRGRGQISYLASVARPTVGLITNIGLTHLELLGSQEEIALAKAELLDEMAAQSLAVLPGRDAFYPLLRAHARGTVITYGEGAGCDIWAEDVQIGADGCARFTVHHGEGAFPVALGAPGRHQVWNALAAIAATMAVGATADQVQAGLAGYQATTGRMQLHRAQGGFTVIDDTYNANPAAVRATLDCLMEMPGGRKVAILGDMRELGPQEVGLHREVGRYAIERGVDALFAVGDLGRAYIEGAADPRARWCADHAEAVAAARACLGEDDVVLVKGSRAMAMEEIVKALLA